MGEIERESGEKQCSAFLLDRGSILTFYFQDLGESSLAKYFGPLSNPTKRLFSPAAVLRVAALGKQTGFPAQTTRQRPQGPDTMY